MSSASAAAVRLPRSTTSTKTLTGGQAVHLIDPRNKQARYTQFFELIAGCLQRASFPPFPTESPPRKSPRRCHRQHRPRDRPPGPGPRPPGHRHRAQRASRPAGRTGRRPSRPWPRWMTPDALARGHRRPRCAGQRLRPAPGRCPQHASAATSCRTAGQGRPQGQRAAPALWSVAPAAWKSPPACSWWILPRLPGGLQAATPWPHRDSPQAACRPWDDLDWTFYSPAAEIGPRPEERWAVRVQPRRRISWSAMPAATAGSAIADYGAAFVSRD